VHTFENGSVTYLGRCDSRTPAKLPLPRLVIMPNFIALGQTYHTTPDMVTLDQTLCTEVPECIGALLSRAGGMTDLIITPLV